MEKTASENQKKSDLVYTIEHYIFYISHIILYVQMKEIIRKLEKTVDGGLAATSTTSNYIYITLDFLTFQHALLCSAREKRVNKKVHT